MPRRWIPAAVFLLSCILAAPTAGAGEAGSGGESRGGSGGSGEEQNAAAAAEWLSRAADARLDARYREYAARRLLMLADSSASILIAALRGEDGSDSALRRQVAATLLGEMAGEMAESAPPEAEPALLEAAFGTDYFLAESAKKALASFYSRLPDGTLYTLLTRGAREFAPAEGGDDWLALSLRQASRRGAFKALVMAGLAKKYAPPAAGSLPELPPRPLPGPLQWCVRDGLVDGNPALRAASVEALRAIPDAQAVERLAALLYTETDANVLITALRVMAALRPPLYGEAVERHTAHAEAKVAVEALAALAAMGYSGALFPAAPGLRAVAAFVNHPSTPVRRRAIEILSDSKNPAAVEYLEAALFDRVGANRAAAAYGLGALGFPSAVGALHPLLNDSLPEVREEAAVALGKFGVVGVASRAVDALRSDAALPFRVAAARALGRMGDVRAVPALVGCLDASEFSLVAAAVDALALLGDARAAEPLAGLAERTDDLVVAENAENALRVLRAAGVPDAEAEGSE